MGVCVAWTSLSLLRFACTCGWTVLLCGLARVHRQHATCREWCRTAAHASCEGAVGCWVWLLVDAAAGVCVFVSTCRWPRSPQLVRRLCCVCAPPHVSFRCRCAWFGWWLEACGCGALHGARVDVVLGLVRAMCRCMLHLRSCSCAHRINPLAHTAVRVHARSPGPIGWRMRAIPHLSPNVCVPRHLVAALACV